MNDGLGVSFAPTAENAEDASRRGALEGIPAAIKVLSLRLPRFLGARGIAPEELLNGQGGNGQDPFATGVMGTLINALLGGAPTPVITPGANDRYQGGSLTEVPQDEVPATPAPGPMDPNQRRQGPPANRPGWGGPIQY